MANLKVSITEEITLPNKNVEKTFNQAIISGVNQIARRIDTITTDFSETGIEIIRFTNNESEQVAGSFVNTDVKYIRITNLDSTNYCTLYFIRTDAESALFKLDPNKSMMLGNADFNASSPIDYIVDGFVDETYYSSFVTLSVIKAKADTANIQLEYFVASA